MNGKQFPVGGVITSNPIGTAQDFSETVFSLQTEYKYPILKRVTYTRHLGAETQRGGGGCMFSIPHTNPPRPPLGIFSYRVGVCIDEALIVALVAFPMHFAFSQCDYK